MSIVSTAPFAVVVILTIIPSFGAVNVAAAACRARVMKSEFLAFVAI
jgi:hypothetical protein